MYAHMSAYEKDSVDESLDKKKYLHKNKNDSLRIYNLSTYVKPVVMYFSYLLYMQCAPYENKCMSRVS